MTDNLAPHNEPTDAPRSGAGIGAHVWGFFAGILSGLAFVQIFGGGILGLLLAYVCLMPLYLTGLGAGRGPVITAALFGIIAVLLQTMAGAGTAPAVMYAFLFGVPAMVISRVSLIETTNGHVSGSVVLLTMLTLGCVLLLGSAFSFSLMGVDIEQVTATVGDNYGAVMRESSPHLTEAQLQQVQSALVRSLPGLLALSWFVIHGINYLIAHWIVSESGRAKRLAPRVSTLTLPKYVSVLCIAGMIGSAYIGGNVAVVLSAISLLLGCGVTLVGLAVLHALLVNAMDKRGLSRGRQTLILAVYYIVFMGLQLPVLLALVIGLLDPWLNARARLIKA